MVAMTSPLHGVLRKVHFACYRCYIFVHFSKPSLRWLYRQIANKTTFPTISYPYRNIVNFSQTSWIHFSSHSAHSNEWGANAEKSQKQPLSLRRGPPSNTSVPGPTPLASHPNDSSIAARASTQLHNNGPIGYSGTVGRPKLTFKTVPSPSTITTLSNTPISWPTPLTIPNGIRIWSAVLLQYRLYTFRTDWPTDGLDDRPVPWALHSLCW